MSASLITWRPCKTRKPHVCNGCGVEMPAGSQMVYARYGSEVLFSAYWCSKCAESHAEEADNKKKNSGKGKWGRNATDISGRRFGKLVAISPTNERSGTATKWLCKCDCGGTTITSISVLMRGHARSCGCLMQSIRPQPITMEKLGRVEKTNVSIIRSKKINARNTSGVRGVSYNKQCGKWETYIGFKRKRYRLGFFGSIKDAARARKEAEAMHDDFVAWFDANQRTQKEPTMDKPTPAPETILTISGAEDQDLEGKHT